MLRTSAPLIGALGSMDTDPVLIAVLTVTEDHRIRCQSLGCNHPVFKRIHVIRIGSEFRLLGSSCFRRTCICNPEGRQTPRYTSRAGRHLTEDERELLIENTEGLVAKLESRWLLEQMEAASPLRKRSRKRGSLSQDLLANIPAQVIAEARARVSREFGIDASLSGWYAYVVEEVKAILRQNAA